MNGASGLQEARSSTSRSSTNRLLHEQDHRFGTGSCQLFPHYELPLIGPQVRMMTPLLTASQNRAASLTANRIIQEKIPNSFPYPLAMLHSKRFENAKYKPLTNDPEKAGPVHPDEGGVK